MAKENPSRTIRNSDLKRQSQPIEHETSLFGNIPKERWPLIILFFLVTIGSFVIWSLVGRTVLLEEYTYKVIDRHPHDSTAFTQGLIYRDGIVYESTGKRGQSKIRKMTLEGRIIDEKSLDDKYFGEGLCEVGDKLYQLTWESGVGFIWDKELNKIDEFKYEGQGWGLTYDGTNLIVSDGTATLRFLDPKTFKEVRRVLVRKGEARMPDINELEFINDTIFANVFGDDMIYLISPIDGKVQGRINFSELLPWRKRPDQESVMNGIAVHPDKQNTLLVTGKNWPFIYEVQISKLVDDAN